MNDFDGLGQLIGGYLNQDMELWAETVPEAISIYARETGSAAHNELYREMDLFLKQYDTQLEEKFKKRYWFDFTPDDIGQTVPEFFAMVRTIIANPDCYRQYETDTPDRPC